MAASYLLVMLLLVIGAFVVGRVRARSVVAGRLSDLHSLPAYHGMLASALVVTPMLALFAVGWPLIDWLATQRAIAQFPAEVAGDTLKTLSALRAVANELSGSGIGGVASPEVKRAAAEYVGMLGFWRPLIFVAGLLTGLVAILWSFWRTTPDFRARNQFETFVRSALIACATVAVLTTLGIVLSVVGETYRFFFDPEITGKPSVSEFLFGLEWNPQTALRADQGDIGGSFGFVPLLVGTLLITAIAIVVAGPLGLFAAIYLAEYASPRFRAFAKPVLEILAGIPTVVLGFFAALTVAPFIRGWGESFGLTVASESALAAGVVMGMMIIPFISSLSDDVITAVPQSLRDGSYAMGATRSETISRVILPAALPGIVSAFMLAISRAIGETMIVVMAAGLAANLTVNPLEAVTTITVQIKTILVGDQEFNSAKTLAAFALGFALFFITLALNFIALQVVKRYREQYD